MIAQTTCSPKTKSCGSWRAGKFFPSHSASPRNILWRDWRRKKQKFELKARPPMVRKTAAKQKIEASKKTQRRVLYISCLISSRPSLTFCLPSGWSRICFSALLREIWRRPLGCRSFGYCEDKVAAYKWQQDKFVSSLGCQRRRV
jgi:hypothetical protein